MNPLHYRQRFLLLAPLCLLSALTEISGMDLVLKDGRKLVEAEFITEEESRIKVKHEAGIVWISKTQVPVAYLQENGASIPAEVGHVIAGEAEQESRLARLRKTFPTFKDKDGRVHDTAHVASVETTGLKLVIDSAVVRVPFHKLPKPVADLLGMDEEAVVQAKQDLESRQTAAREESDLRRTATSILARQKCYVDLEIVQYEKDGYICYGTVLERKVEQVETEVGYNLLRRQKMFENRSEVTLEAGRHLGRMKVYGLPADLVGKKTWRGELWLGNWRVVETAQGESVETRDAFTALQAGVDHLLKHGLGVFMEDLNESRKGPESNPVDPFGSPMNGDPLRGTVTTPGGTYVPGAGGVGIPTNNGSGFGR